MPLDRQAVTGIRVYPRVGYGSGRIFGHGSGTGTGRIFSYGYGSGRKFLYPQTPNLQSPSKQKPIKNLRENGAWAYPGSAQIFRVPLLSKLWEKLRTSNFAYTFIGCVGTKAH